MRYLVGSIAGQQSVFSVDGERATNLSAALPEIGTDLAALTSDPGLRDRVLEHPGDGAQVNLADITPALPIGRPGKVVCLGLNYVDHIKEGGYDIPEYPALFMRGPNSLMAAEAPMVVPGVSERLDYEVELMIVVGKGGRHISKEDAYNHVFGYTVFNDGSVRDYQRKTHQWTPGKNFDDTGAIGPIVVTPDEIAEGADGLRIESRINGKVMQSANTAEMLWKVPQIIATISEYATLEPGDMIATGTPPGVGHARTPPRFLKPGDVVEAEVEGICICKNPVVAE